MDILSVVTAGLSIAEGIADKINEDEQKKLDSFLAMLYKLKEVDEFNRQSLDRIAQENQKLFMENTKLKRQIKKLKGV